MKKKFELTSTYILAILIVITLIIIMLSSSLLSTYSSVDTSVFIDRVNKMYNEVNKNDNTDKTFYSDNENILSSDYSDLKYCIILDDNGNIDNFVVGNDKYYVNVKEADIKESDVINEAYPYATCNKILFSQALKCASNAKIEDGTIYREKDFEYKYNYNLELINDEFVWVKNDKYEGWGVKLIGNPKSMEVCSKINDKDVVSMKYLFSSYMHEADFSKLDTRNIKDMSYMFYYYHGNKVLNLNSFDTRKVENMSYMFNTTGIKELDIRNFVINDEALLNGMLSNNRILTKVIVKDDKTIKKIEKNNGMYDRLNLVLPENN